MAAGRSANGAFSRVTNLGIRDGGRRDVPSRLHFFQTEREGAEPGGGCADWDPEREYVCRCSRHMQVCRVYDYG